MNRRPPGQVRIIGGTLRGSKLPVADRPGLRPTGDRTRETLFNWLQPHLPGARVLDAFAGSGALGFEAASRGAADVLLLERDPTLAASLRDSARRLHADAVQVEAIDALAWLGRAPEPRFDIAFLDPPFEAGLWQRAAAALAPWLAGDALVYVELSADAAFVPLAGWSAHREGRTRGGRQVLYRVAGIGPGVAATLAGDTPGTGRRP